MAVCLEKLKMLLQSHHTVPFHTLGLGQEALFCTSLEIVPVEVSSPQLQRWYSSVLHPV